MEPRIEYTYLKPFHVAIYKGSKRQLSCILEESRKNC